MLQRWPFPIWSIYGIYGTQNHWKELKACWISSLKAVKPSFVFWDCSSESQIITSLLASPSQTSSWWIKLKQIQASEKSSFQQLRLSAIASIKTFQNSKPSTFAGPFFLTRSPRFFLVVNDSNLFEVGVDRWCIPGHPRVKRRQALPENLRIWLMFITIIHYVFIKMDELLTSFCDPCIIT